MIDIQNQKINKFKKDVAAFNIQRGVWMILSAVVFIGMLAFGLSWNFLVSLHSHVVWTAVVSTGLTITVVWWYWTMVMVRKLLAHQDDVIAILIEITSDVKTIREHVSDLVEK